jgi:glycosyltransferase involved in cell wall biosynthesis
VDLILRALGILKRRGSCPRFLIAGKGSDRDRLLGLSSRLGLGGLVRFLGFVDEAEKIRLFQKSWVHVLTSPKEGWGISAMEAAACGTPTVASDSPGLRDVVRHNLTGLLVPHGNPEALADGLTRLLSRESERMAMGAAARRHAEEFSWERSAREMQDFLVNRVARGSPKT